MIQEKVLEVNSFDDRLRRSRGCLSRNAVASAKVTRDEQIELEDAAQAEGKALSEWAREVLLREARYGKGDAMFTELIAMRMLLNQVLRPIAEGHGVTMDGFTEIIADVRQQKHTVARQLREQYSGQQPKEQ